MALKEYSGNAPATRLSGTLASGTTTNFGVITGGGTGYPTGATAPFVIVIDRDTPSEEKILVATRSGDTFSGLTRGYDGAGSGVAHAAQAVVEHVWDSISATEANLHVNDDARDDHSQYLNSTRHAATGHTSAMLTDLTILTADIADNQITTAKILDANVTTAKIADAQVTVAKLAADAVAGLSNVDVFDTNTGETPATTPYKVQAGSNVLSFTGGNATLTFPTAFPTAVLTLVVCNGDAAVGNHAVISVASAGLALNQAALVAVASHDLSGWGGNLRINWYALGY